MMSVCARLVLLFAVRVLRISPGWLPRRKLDKSNFPVTKATKKLSSEGDLQPQLTLTRLKPMTLKWEALAIDFSLTGSMALGTWLI